MFMPCGALTSTMKKRRGVVGTNELEIAQATAEAALGTGETLEKCRENEWRWRGWGPMRKGQPYVRTG